MSSTNDTSPAAASRTGQSAGQFAASLVTALVIFGVQVFAFLLIKDRFARIYQPRTYLVPERERTKPAAPGWWAWIKPVLSTSNSEFVQKCGLDAYFFLRYLRTLLKIFVPAAIIILPILLPLNTIGGRGSDWSIISNGTQPDVKGLDQLSWGNIRPEKNSRYWAHWFLALCLVCYVCYIAFDELRNYIRMRQAYITSPQHRLRASATTVLVGSIPAKWLSVEALDGLYDVFPGGIRNIWINRNYDKLNEKVHRRDDLARKLEASETELVKKCFKKQQANITKAEKEAGRKRSRAEKKTHNAAMDEKGRKLAQNRGLEAGNPHQVKHTLAEALENSNDDGQNTETAHEKKAAGVPIIGEGIAAIGQGFDRFRKEFVGGLQGVGKGVNSRLNATNGFIASEDPHHQHQEDSQGIRPATTTSMNASVGDEPSPLSVGGFDGSSEHTRVANSQENDRRALISSKTGAAGAIDQDVEQTTSSPAPNEVRRTDPKTELSDRTGYGECYNTEFEGDAEDAVWRKYIGEKDRDTMRLPLFGLQWMPSLPFLGEKVDTIYYCRKEVARLNGEIEDDQAHPERFQLMNSAFIQFNHQVAAHMACQAVSHHLPKQMAPRIVEIDPNDVIWDNMSIPWWQTYIRTAGVVTIVTAMIILWAIPVAFTSALSQLSVAAETYDWLSWILRAPDVIISILQGVLAPVLLALLMFLLPIFLRLLSRLQGMQSGVLVELSVQKMYFYFLFVQVFFVVTIANSAVVVVSLITSTSEWGSIPTLLADNIPRASNYFFSYMLLQAFSVSAGALVQVGSLVGWFILAPLLDNTARAKFRRQTQLVDIQWGTFFPVYTNLACIGLIYSVISPLILVFNIMTFALFWFVYRYQTLYVTKFTLDTGGLLFPNAINLTFVGLYVMEVGLICMFFFTDGTNAQAIGMIVILILTAGYQILLNNAFSPLFRYLPVTLEDDAVRRDEEFARAMRIKHGYPTEADEEGAEDIEDQLEEHERESLEEDRSAQNFEMRKIESGRKEGRATFDPALGRSIELQNPEVNMDVDREHKSLAFLRRTANRTAGATINRIPGSLKVPVSERRKSAWADRDNVRNRRSTHFAKDVSQSPDAARGRHTTDTLQTPRRVSPPRQVLDKLNNFNPLMGDVQDLEAQQAARKQLSDALFGGISDELEDLTPEQRDELTYRAFQHSAMRSRRPVIWIPRDELGVSDSEVTRMSHFSRNLWVSNARQGLDSKGRCVYSGAPPDFSEVDVIRL